MEAPLPLCHLDRKKRRGEASGSLKTIFNPQNPDLKSETWATHTECAPHARSLLYLTQECSTMQE
jgi:hypothetical protein